MSDKRLVQKKASGIFAIIGSLLLNSVSYANLTCDAKSIQAVVPGDTTILSATEIAKPTAHCKVDGYILTTEPGPDRINFRIQLPDRNLWKRRFYFVGEGGTAGYVPTESEIPQGNPMRQGFVVAGTDMGVERPKEGGTINYSFLDDPAKAINFNHRGAHLATVVAQQITRAYYDTEKFWRYHSGCSGGGRMGGEAAMWYPSDYDGILYGASRVTMPSRIDTGVWLRALYTAQQMQREPGAWLSPAKLKMVDKNVTAACDATDGAIDGVVWDPRKCKYDVASLRCKSGDASDCLTDPEIKSLKAILEGAHGPDGRLLFDPFPITNMGSWSQLGSTPPPYSKDLNDVTKSSTEYLLAESMGIAFFGQNFDIASFDFNSKSDLDRWIIASRRTGIGYAHDLTPMFRTGGKIISWAGASDANVTPGWAATDYAQFLADNYFPRGMEDVLTFLQTYVIPGIGHCGGGTGPADAPDRLMQALIEWVEQGKTPGGIVMHSADKAQPIFADAAESGEAGAHVPLPTGPSRDFLVCPYPLVSVFAGGVSNVNKLDVYSAANWSCQAPPH